MALVAVVLAAVAPTTSHALQDAGTNGWIELCSALGSRWVELPAGMVVELQPGGYHVMLMDLKSHVAVERRAQAAPDRLVAVGQQDLAMRDARRDRFRARRGADTT
ncbi:MAG: copper chaperone PCu(A)C [Burkholderiaceae bacterium]